MSGNAIPSRVARLELSIDAHIPIDSSGYWPDNNAPSRTPTSEQAAAVVRQYISDHGIRGFLSDWDIADSLTIMVDDVIAYQGVTR